MVIPIDKIKTHKLGFINLSFPVLILCFFILSFGDIFDKMIIRWSTDDNNYCYLVVPLFIYLLWDRRSRFAFKEIAWSIWGIVPVLFSLSLVLLGELGSVETLSYIGIWGCLAGMAFLLYGYRSRLLGFPFVILFFIVPLPPFINNMLTFDLKLAASTSC